MKKLLIAVLIKLLFPTLFLGQSIEIDPSFNISLIKKNGNDSVPLVASHDKFSAVEDLLRSSTGENHFIVEPRSLNFGEVLQGEFVTLLFAITNPSD